MTQQILFLIVVLIGAYYARKYGNKAKRDIEKYNQNKEQDKIKNKNITFKKYFNLIVKLL